MAIEVHRDMVRGATSAFDDGEPVTEFATPTAGDIVVIKRGSALYLALVDSFLGGGGGASLPVDVVAPAAGQEVYGVVGGVPKRIPIVQLINDAYPAPLGLWDYWTDWRAASGNANAPGAFAGAAISSGTNTTALPTAGMSGFNDHGVFLRSSTTANGGYRYQTTSLVGMYFSGVARKYRCQFLWRTSFTGVTVRTGFHDSSSSADAVDGAYFEISGATCSAKTANNSTRTTHATTITLALDTAYTFDIEVNAAASEARFRVWAGNNYDAAVMDVTITTNIPSTSARTFGAGIVATEASTTAMDIGILYSLGVGTPAGFARMYGVYSTPVVRPSAFVDGNWTATAVSGGVELNITAMPASGSSAVTAIRYRLDGGAPVTLSGTGTGVRTITGLTAGQEYALQIQQVTAAGESDWSDTKRRTPLAAGGGGGGGLTIVQQPAKVETFASTVERSLTAVGSGNHLIVAVRGETAAGVPTITDSAGGSWSAAVHSYGETQNNSTAYYFIRSGVTGGLTWVRATFGSGNECCIGVVEVSGGTPTLDATLGAAVGSLTDPWNMAFTSTAANALMVGMASFSNATTVTDVAPLDGDATSEYFAYFRGLFPTAGSNTAVLDLNDSRQGAYSGIVVKA